VHLGRGIATIPTLVTVVDMRVTTHPVATLHRLLWRGHASAVESIRNESDGQCREKNPHGRPHQGGRLVALDERVKAHCVQSVSRLSWLRTR
jgi:hypothetical protein